MTRKKKTETSVVPAVPERPELVRTMGGFGSLVRVDAVYHVQKVHPSDDGPWAVEADKVAWTDPLTGYGCIIRRSPAGGHLCGYVSVPPGHPLFGRRLGSFVGLGIGVHGGIDYAAECEDWQDEDRSVCHVLPADFQQSVYANAAAERGDDAWWLGFSCNQSGDILPDPRNGRSRVAPRAGLEEPTYKTEGFVYQECVRLAAQLKAIEDGRDPQQSDPGPTPPPRSIKETGR